MALFNYFKVQGPLVVTLLIFLAVMGYNDYVNRKSSNERIDRYEVQTNKRFSDMETHIENCEKENEDLNKWIRETHIETLEKINKTLSKF